MRLPFRLASPLGCSLTLCYVIMTGVARTHAAQDLLPEEIVIRGEQQRTTLQEKTFRAAQEAYAIFSKLNDNPHYDVICRREEPTGSKLTVTTCRPAYMDELLMDAGGDPFNVPGAELEYHKKALNQLMNKYLAESEELRDAMVRFNSLNNELVAINQESSEKKETTGSSPIRK